MKRFRSRAAHYLFAAVVFASAVGASELPPLRQLSTDVIHGSQGPSITDYSFTAGPGEVMASAEALLAADAVDARLALEIFDGSAQSLASAFVGNAVDRGRDRVEETLRRGVSGLLAGVVAPPPVKKRKAARVTLEETETLILRVTVGSGVTRYSVSLEGAIDFTGEAMAATSDIETEGVVDDAATTYEAETDTLAPDTGAELLDDADAASLSVDTTALPGDGEDAVVESVTVEESSNVSVGAGEEATADQETEVEEVANVDSPLTLKVPGPKGGTLKVPGRKSGNPEASSDDIADVTPTPVVKVPRPKPGALKVPQPKKASIQRAPGPVLVRVAISKPTSPEKPKRSTAEKAPATPKLRRVPIAKNPTP